jgi:hypothetical protein
MPTKEIEDNPAKDLQQIINDCRSPLTPQPIINTENHPLSVIKEDLLMEKLVIYISNRDGKILEHGINVGKESIDRS